MIQRMSGASRRRQRKLGASRSRLEHYDVMCGKSEIINLGVVSADPSSTPGAITIMSQMDKFVPEGQEITCGGWGLQNMV